MTRFIRRGARAGGEGAGGGGGAGAGGGGDGGGGGGRGGARGNQLARRGSKPGTEPRRIFHLVSAAFQGVPSQHERVLSRHRLQSRNNRRQVHEARGGQPALDLGVLHEKFPDPLGTIVFNRDHNRALVNSQFI